ncbi:MAG: hypothetical protein JNK84_03450 [Phreatobacter sp.]|uniref:hypothetical protein n=1 Tax=Phreatobacter sp. TaxID=1966341 RepID=UPI001A3CC60B|nr:hypothetical protein [Phreatobacter sp.]MBL8568120.1 hypothetical protein [Phreatobacter sp.]
MSRRTSRTNGFVLLARPALLGMAGAIATVVTLTVGEFRPARSLGPIASAQALAVAPSHADLDYAHGAFERFRDQPDTGARPSTIAAVHRSISN